MPEDTIREISAQVIDDQQFPSLTQTEGGDGATGGSRAVNQMTPDEIPDRNLPSQTIANDVISSSFDTQSRRILGEFEFSINGALQIGKFEEGVSGDIRISPNGIFGRDLNGDPTVTIDTTTGDATFRGTIAAGSLIAGRTDIGVPNGNVYIDGNNVRIIISDGTHDRILIGRDIGGF